MNFEHHPIWDQEALLGRMRGKSERVVKLVNLFLNDIPARIQELNEDVQQNNIDNCAMHAHTVKGVSANLSVLRLEQIASEIEVAAKKQHIDELIALLSDINRVYEESEDELKKFIAANS